MSWAKLSLFVLFAVALACGQVLFTLAAESLKGPLAVDARTALQLATNRYLLLGLGLYFASTLLWDRPPSGHRSQQGLPESSPSPSCWCRCSELSCSESS